MSRSVYLNAHRDAYDEKAGPIAPLFAEEVDARTSVATGYVELKATDKKLHDPYCEDLVRVAAASFVPEYVWVYLHEPTWGDAAPKELRLGEFDSWRAAHLAGHIAQTRGGLAFADQNKPKSDPPKREVDSRALLKQGREALQKGDPQRAITDSFDKVIDAFETAFKGTDRILYSTQTQEQALLYTALPNPEKRAVAVVNGDWADAYMMKGYALNELNRRAEARAALEAAVRLAPLDAQALSELAFTYQAMKNCDKSLELYARAATAAEIASSDQNRTEDLTKAWRGHGYCLVEQGQFDEAEALYNKCLVRDPSDSKSRGELDYIRRTRPH